MERPTTEAWLVVADSEHARLMHVTRTAHDRVHLDEVTKLSTTFQAGEHHRPTRLSQAGRSGPVGHEHELKTGHFAREVATWLEKELVSRRIAKCTVFAPTHFLGALHPALGKAVAGKVQEEAGELAQFTMADLSRHPRIAALLPK